MWFLQTFHTSSAVDAPAAAGGMCRAVLRKGREVVSPLSLIASMDADEAMLDDLRAAAPSSENEALSILERALT